MSEPQAARLDAELLTSLVDGEESLASLLGGLLGLEMDGSTPTTEVLEALDRLESAGLIDVGYWGEGSAVGEFPGRPTPDVLAAERARFPTVGAAAAEPWPFIGLWYRLTPRGREFWSSRIGDKRAQVRHWIIQEPSGRDTVVVQAADDRAAQMAVETWKRSNPLTPLSAVPDEIETGVSFAMRDGTQVHDGVRWTFSRTPTGHSP